MKRGQSEIVGFGLIIILVSVVLLIFLSLSFKQSNNDSLESYEVTSFLQSYLKTTTTCADKSSTDFMSTRELIFSCSKKESCFDSKNSCEVLESFSNQLLEYSWQVSSESFYKGYDLRIFLGEEELLNLSKGNQTQTSKGSIQTYEDELEIIFEVYN